jgi:hypothetical protein
MINVVCFCGRSYSFEGELSSCPQCGELVSFTRGAEVEAEGTQGRFDRLLTKLAIDLPPEEMAA